MWFAIISSIIFLAITTFLFTPEFRIFPIYRSLSFFFLFEGTYALINFIVTELWHDYTLMPTIHDIGCIIFGLYILITAYSYKKRNHQFTVSEINNTELKSNHLHDNKDKESALSVINPQSNDDITGHNPTQSDQRQLSAHRGPNSSDQIQPSNCKNLTESNQVQSKSKSGQSATQQSQRAVHETQVSPDQIQSQTVDDSDVKSGQSATQQSQRAVHETQVPADQIQSQTVDNSDITTKYDVKSSSKGKSINKAKIHSSSKGLSKNNKRTQKKLLDYNTNNVNKSNNSTKDTGKTQ